MGQILPGRGVFGLGRTLDYSTVEHLLPPAQQAYLFPNVSVLNAIACHLATATVAGTKDAWAVLSDRSPSLQTFALYGQRFGGIEPHFKDYKSAAFGVLQSGLRDAQALSCLFMLLDCASLIALMLGRMCVPDGKQSQLDWHGQRGLSFLQLGLRALARCCYQRLLLPLFRALSKHSPPPACASHRKHDTLDCRIEFSKVTNFSY
ncbi:hypothetical protein [Leptodesmis sp.]|uniref:hypothetical protein n=1 Tax=Leptodesmis sp. TaxID=3100501 RepID=UPI004053587E